MISDSEAALIVAENEELKMQIGALRTALDARLEKLDVQNEDIFVVSNEDGSALSVEDLESLDACLCKDVVMLTGLKVQRIRPTSGDVLLLTGTQATPQAAIKLRDTVLHEFGRKVVVLVSETESLKLQVLSQDQRTVLLSRLMERVERV